MKNIKTYEQFIVKSDDTLTNEGILNPIANIKAIYNKLINDPKVVAVINAEIQKNKETPAMKAAVEKLKQSGKDPASVVNTLNIPDINTAPATDETNPLKSAQAQGTPAQAPLKESLLTEGAVWNWVVRHIPYGGMLAGLGTMVDTVMKHQDILLSADNISNYPQFAIGIGLVLVSLIYKSLVLPLLQQHHE